MNSDEANATSMTNIMQELNAIVSGVSYAVKARDIHGVLQRIAETTRELINAKYAALGIPDEKNGLLYFKVSGISEEQHHRLKGNEPKGLGLLGAIVHERLTIRLDDLAKDPRSIGFPEHHPEMTSFLGVPIQVGEHLYGMLYLCDRNDGKPFDQRDQWLVEATAGYAALAITGLEVSQQSRRIALFEDRERIAMELHDGIIQSLYAIGMHLDLVRTSEHIEPEKLLSAIRSLNTVIDDIRNYILNLRSSEQPGRTVYECLNEVIEKLHVSASIQVHLEAPATVPNVLPSTFEAVCLIVQEAISNTVRHANASNLKVVAGDQDGQFVISVEDDGRGFNMNDLNSHNGLGLSNIKRRANIHGGHVAILSEPGKGTKLEISMPLPSD